MILTKEKAALLLEKLEKHCKKNKVSLPRNKSMRMIELAKAVMQRYGSVVLVEGAIRLLCNNPKFLKKWAFGESLKNAGSALRLENCGELGRKYMKLNKTEE